MFEKRKRRYFSYFNEERYRHDSILIDLTFFYNRQTDDNDVLCFIYSKVVDGSLFNVLVIVCTRCFIETKRTGVITTLVLPQ